MFGISYSSTGVVDLFINKEKYQRCTIETLRKKLVRKSKGEIIETIEAYDPKKAFNSFMKQDPGGRVKVVLVHGYNTLHYLTPEIGIKFIVFDAPQILAKKKVKIIDAKPMADGQGTWKNYKILPEAINNEIESTEGGFSYKKETQKYTIRHILKNVTKKLEKKKGFKKLVARYIFGMVKISQWKDRVEKMKKKLKIEDYVLLMDWLNSFATDALCMAYTDMIKNAPKLCDKWGSQINEEEMDDKLIQKFETIVKRACSTAEADFEDFMYLAKILPPNSDFLEKILVPMPIYLEKFRSKYPLIPGSKTRKLVTEKGKLK